LCQETNHHSLESTTTEPLVHLDLVDEEGSPIAMPARKRIAEYEANRFLAVEGGEEDRVLVVEQLDLRLARRERAHDVLVARPEPPDLHQRAAASRSSAGALSQYDSLTHSSAASS